MQEERKDGLQLFKKMSEEHGKVEVQYLLEDWFAVISSDGTVTLHVDVCLVLCRTYTTVRYGFISIAHNV